MEGGSYVFLDKVLLSKDGNLSDGTASSESPCWLGSLYEYK